MSFIRKLLFAALLAPLLGGPGLRAAEFEVLNRFSVDGYTVLRGSADIPGGSFAVGLSTFVIRDGKVGIGTPSPNALLNIFKSSDDGTVAGNPFIILSNRNNTNGTFVSGGILNDSFRDVANPHYSAGLWFLREPYSANNSSAGDIVFGTGANVGQSSLPAERMRINSSGNVGIGTTAPGVKLDVDGEVKIGSTTIACDATKAGVLRWTSGHLFVCNGADWRQLDNQPPPTVSAINPPSGTVSGGTAITISGSGFNLGLTVLIDGAGAGVIGVTASQITATTPAGAAGSKEVKIINPDGQNCLGSFTYNPLPTVASVTPSSGQTSRTTNITIAGTGYLTGAGVTIGGVTATVNTVSATQITAVAPAIAVNGGKDVTVTNFDTGSVTRTSGFTYVAFATGGAESDSGIYHIHTFNSSDAFVANFAGNVEVLLVAGGGGAGNDVGGAGGGGGVVYNASVSLAAGSLAVVVGSGGAGNGGNGGNSSFPGVTTAVGGGGGGTYASTAGKAGGSGGGGGGGGVNAGGAGTSGQGNNGGAGSAGTYASGAGGGAGAAGGAASGTTGYDGGIGLAYSISGTSTYYGGGGGGGGSSAYGQGGLGGGGRGELRTSSNGQNGTANTGGGAGGHASPNTGGATGGSGIVIIRYQR